MIVKTNDETVYFNNTNISYIRFSKNAIFVSLVSKEIFYFDEIVEISDVRDEIKKIIEEKSS